MRKNTRDSGIDIIGEVPWGTHFCQFYQTKEDLMDILVPYFKAGLENNELCIWITSKPLKVEEAKAAMKRVVPDIDGYLKKGQIEIIPYTHGYLKGGIFDPDRAVNSWVEKINQALTRGYDGLRAVGDNRWLEKEGWNGFIDCENKVDAIIDKHHVIALCPYYLDMCSTAETIDVVSNHQFALIKREGKWERIENSGRKRAEEEAVQAAKNWEYTFDAVPDMVAIIGDKYRVVRANKAIAARLGMTPEECIGLTCCRVIHGTDSAPSFCPHRQLLKDGAEHTAEICGEGLGGDFLVSTSPIHDSEGKLIGSVYVARDITKRKQEEHHIRRYNRILEGINQIFSKVVQAKTEEELGNACLSVALEVTGSQFGFINEMDADGLLLHDVAKSKLAWEQCLMYDKTGHRRLSSDFIVHGLYGSVIINEKSFLTNDPQSHPDSIGVPPGHPPLTSFLRVPLVLDGKMMGLIAVANREEGYSCEQQEDLEAIAPAVTQALQGKRSEEALKLSNIYNRSLIEASLDPLVTIGRDGKITDVNGATEQVTGYSRNELIGTDFSDYFTEPEKARTGYQQVFKDGEVRDYPLGIQRKDEHITPVLYNASVYRDENGKVIGVFAAARDITERKKAEEALKRAHESLEEKVKERTIELEKAYNSLKESEKGLAEAQKMAHIGNWDWNLLTGEAYWSDEMYWIFGRNPHESGVTYDELLNYIHPEDRDYVDSALKKAVKGKTHSIEYRIVLANGEERVVYMQSEVIFDENGTPIQVKGIVQDVTERKRAEEKLQTLANAVESSNDAIITESLDGTIASWNKAAEQVYGYSAEEILGKDVSILEPENLKGEIRQFSEKIKQGKKIQHYETLRLKKDGTIINISVTLSPIFDVTGKLVAISAIVRDVTERIKAEEALRESEARLRQFYESDMIGTLYFNLDGSITDANDKLLEIVGYTREDLQSGKISWDKITSPEYRFLDERAITELRTMGVKEPQEKEYIRKDGSHVPVIVGVATFDRVRNEGIAFILDITERKKAEEALANLEITRKKEIHHRIKNNLQVISSLLDLQAEQFKNRECVENSEVLEAFRESQDRVISMALIHEELYKGEETETLDFSAYIRELAENLFHTYSLSSKNTHLSMDLEENAFFDMDIAVPLGIIVNELVSNSLKHAFPGRDRGKIQIELHRDENGENKKEGNKSTSFILTVSDNGVGIPEDLNIEALDSLGFQLITTLVDQLDGELELKKNDGTEFAIRFTVREENNQTPATLQQLTD
ncbi:MAG TPA: PAS domain S-box protein [Methanosarcina sp.]|nr:PAS domain S-box protein [Methanosarcina sp.]